MKRLAFCGASRADLMEFPETARRRAGFQLDRVQRGLDPDDWKPMATIGAGVREIRIAESSGEFRVIYVATFPEIVFVLHAFQKKTQRMASRDVELAARRFRDLARSLKT